MGPFTTPMLTGARIRRMSGAVSIAGERALIGPDGGGQAAADRFRDTALEIIVPNPSGGRGVYILPWADIAALCRPTMHDVMLGRFLATPLDGIERDLTPVRMREAGCHAAIQGLAGRAAARAATQFAARRAEDLVATRFALLTEITEQIEAWSTPLPPLAAQHPLEIKRRGGLALTALAIELGQPGQHMADLLDILAVQYIDVGLGPNAAAAGLPRLIASLGQLRHDVVEWAQGEKAMYSDQNPPVAPYAQAIASAAELAARMSRALLDAARQRLTDMPALMKTLLSAPTEIADVCQRPSWLLDGWEPICVLWRAAPTLLTQNAALLEISWQVPQFPDEAAGWLKLPQGTAEQLSRHPAPKANARPSDISVLDRIARNEQLRALANE